MRLKIATGRSKKETKWKNIEISWSEFLSKIKTTHRTHETVAEYSKMSRDKQGDIKDIGGFVGGHLKDGRRGSSNVLYRSMLTLDADYACKSFWEDLIALNDYACCIYSTHKHTPSSPRLRLIIPLKRTVSPEEYEAVARMIAKDLGIDMFDDTTYQPSRLMYWPSTSKDGQYVFEVQDGDVLDPAEILARYPDWSDVSFWPQSSRVQEIHVKQAKKQGDPLDKDGVIGAFCRTYDIASAIDTFLSDIYEECDTPNRYTYKGGSTAAGLVVYEDKWAYSNHSTDPAGGKLCNAFDLVRVHLYGDLDEDIKEDTPINKTPSYLKMIELASSDTKTKVELINDIVGDINIQDDADASNTLEDDNDWVSKLSLDKKGIIENTISNIVLILRNDKLLKNNIAYNQLSYQPEIKRDLPWRKIITKGAKVNLGKSWLDSDDSQLSLYLEQKYNTKFSDSYRNHAVSIVSTDNAFHPIKAYLDSCKWDGINRIDTLLIDLFDAEDCDYTKAVMRKTLVAAVKRIYEPGCKFDTMLTLSGGQGIGKSTLFDKLGGEWFSDSLTSLKGKEAFEQLQGVWIMEMGELTALKKAEAEQIKSYLSKRKDTYRMAYGKRNVECPRQNIFVGTTNSKEILKDKTGNRRFWIVPLGQKKADVFEVCTPEFIKQCWAEALHFYRQGETLHLDAELSIKALETQDMFMEDDPVVQDIEEYLNMPIPNNWYDMDPYERRNYFNSRAFEKERDTGNRIQKVCTKEIFNDVLGYEYNGSYHHKLEAKIVAEIIGNIPGWERYAKVLKIPHYGVTRGWVNKVTNAVTIGNKFKE